MGFLRKENGRICPVRLLLLAGFVSLVFTIGGMLIGNLLEKE